MTRSNVAFIFPGHGSHYPGILRELARTDSRSLEMVTTADPIVERFFGWKLSPFVTGRETGTPLDFERSQVLIFLAGVVMHEVLVGRGLTPDVLVGHSLGEIAALVAGGMLDFETGLTLVCQRTSALRRHSVSGGMLVLASDVQRAEQLLRLLEPVDARIAVRNSPSQVVVSGTPEALARVEAVARSVGLMAQRIDAAFPFHSPWMEDVARDLGKVLGEVVAKTPHTRVYSPIALAEYAAGAPLGQVLAEHLTRPVSFTEAVNRLYDEGTRVFIEAGGRTALSALVRDTLAERQDIVMLASNDPKQGELASLEAVLSRCEDLGLRRPPVMAGPASLQERIERMTPLQLVEEIQRLSAALAARLGTPTAPIHLVPAAPAPETPERREQKEQKEAVAREEAAPLDRSVLVQRIVSIYQRATDYPAEVFELDADFEAELGIDSVKQMQLLAMLQREFQLPELGKLRVKDFNTLSRVVDLVAATSNASNLAA